jgi:hypothetical protein
MNKIRQAYEDFIKNGLQPVLESSGKYKIDAPISDSIKVRMYITKNGVLKTAYPIFE